MVILGALMCACSFGVAAAGCEAEDDTCERLDDYGRCHRLP